MFVSSGMVVMFLVRLLVRADDIPDIVGAEADADVQADGQNRLAEKNWRIGADIETILGGECHA
jgi:hypothetical protein